MMKLDFYQPGVTLPQRLPLQRWSSKPEVNTVKSECSSSTWVKLQECPSPYSHDEALLLCQHSDSEWMAWVPGYGEIVLHRSQFSEIE
ncbi:hypothetical protein NDI39_15575 [Microcoleus sp. ZQ-A2]